MSFWKKVLDFLNSSSGTPQVGSKGILPAEEDLKKGEDYESGKAAFDALMRSDQEQRKESESSGMLYHNATASEEDIAPSIDFSNMTPANSVEARRKIMNTGKSPLTDDQRAQWLEFGKAREEAESNDGEWFKSGAFEDGYQFGDITVGTTATVLDVATGLVEGLMMPFEGLSDYIIHGAAYGADALGYEEKADAWHAEANENSMQNLFDPLDKHIKPYSSFGDNTEKWEGVVGNLGGQLLMTYATAGIGTAAPIIAQGLSSAGSATTEAYQGRATDEEAAVYGLSSGLVSAATESAFGGLGKGIKAIGVSKGIGGFDDIFAKKVTEKISDVTVRNAVEFGIKSTGEGLEEVMEAHASAVFKKMTYMSEEELSQLIEDENALEDFIIGTIWSGTMQSGAVPGMKNGSLADSNKNQTDFITGRTQNEEAVINKEVEKRVAEKEAKGEKVSVIEKNKIYDKVVEDIEKGYISIETIEKALGGESYEAYNSIVKDYAEYNELYNTKSGDLSEAQRDRLAELKAKAEEQSYEDQIKAAREKLSLDTYNLLKGERNGAGSLLGESYNEVARRGQRFTADLTKYDAKQKATIQRAIDSGVLNNSNRTHDFVDMLAKIEADKGVKFDFANNKKLKESGFALEGKTVNGYVTKDGITLNIDSHKALDTVAGHEITHVLEGTEVYEALQEAVFTYAKSKGEYQSRLDALTKLYEGVKDADVNKELTADLIGDYLFSDNDFIVNLSTKHRNVFEKIYDEIKYLYKIATAGSKQARELERVKNLFEKAYKESGAASGDTKYSLSDSDGKTLTKEQNEYFKDSKMRDENGNLKVMYHGSRDAGFHIFDSSMSDDGTSFFFVDRNDVAASYSGTSETYEAQTIHTAEDMNNFIESIGAEGYEVVEKDGKFTLLYEGDRVADSNTAKGIYEEFCWYEGVGEGDANYKVYLNLKNPLIVDAEGRNWNNISREYSQEIADRYNSLTAEEKAALTNLAEWGEYSIFKDEMLDARAAAEQGVSSGYGDVAFTKTLARAYQKLGGANANLYDAFSIASDNFSDESIKQFAVKQMKTRDYAEKAKAEGYDGVIFKNIHDNGGYSNGSEGASTVAIAFSSEQIKSVANEKPTSDPDIRYSLTEEESGILKDVGLEYDAKSETVSYSLSSLEDTFNYHTDSNGVLLTGDDYQKARDEYVNALAKSIAMDKGNPTAEEKAKASKYLDGLFLVHDMIAADKDRLDYEAAVDKSAWVSNSEYGGSIDFSTLCAKRRLFTGTFDAIQNALPDTVLNENDFLRIRDMLLEKELESPCSMCYVEGSRANHGKYVDKFLKDYLATNPEWKPQIADFTSSTRLERTRIEHPEAYAAYQKAMNKLAQRKPKEASVRTDYKGEILVAFADGSSVEIKNNNGGIRFNSFSDFEIIHALDCMQVITDMARVGLNGQAYTKVKEFAESFGSTGLKINLSLVAKDVDANGKLIMDEVNGMKYAEAMDIRNKYSDNVGTVIVVFNDEQLRAALSDSAIDYVLPFHRSQWKKSQYTMMGLPTITKDYTALQNDRITNPKTGKPVKLSKLKQATTYTNDITGETYVIKDNIMPNMYWDYSKSGRENANRYLDYINANGMTPKFDFLLDKVDGKWALPEGAVGDGYFKLLIDFKMYNNEGWGAPQNPVLPEFNMPYIQEMLNNYVGGHQSFPVAHDVVDKFVEGKKNGTYSLSADGDTSRRYGNIFGEDVKFTAPVAEVLTGATETAEMTENTAPIQNVTEGENEALEDIMPEGFAPVTEEEANALASESLASLDDADAPVEVDSEYYSTPDNTRVNDKTVKSVSESLAEVLALDSKEAATVGDVVQRYSTGEISEAELFDEIRSKYGEKLIPHEDEQTAQAKRELRGYKLYVSDTIKSEIPNYNRLRQSLFGKLFTKKRENGGTPVDVAYMELSELYPAHFPADIINPTDQFLLMAELARYNTISYESQMLPDEDIQQAVDIITSEVVKSKEAAVMQNAEEGRRALMDEIAPVIEKTPEKAYEAIRPKKETASEPRMKSTEPRMKRADSKNTAPDGMEERSWYETSTGSEAVDNMITPDDIPDEVRYYQVKSNEKTLATANARLARDGYAKSREYFEGRMSERKLTVEDIALGERLIQEAAKAGDSKAVRDLIIDVSIIGTELGQRVQALSMIRRLTPEGQLKALTRTVERGKAKGDKAFEGVEITQEMIDHILKTYGKDGTFDQKNLNKAVEDVKQQIADQMHVGAMDYINAWRYLSMLGNPKTHIRNVVSNVAMFGTRTVKNAIARTIETIAPIETRTKTWRRASDAVKSFAEQTTKEMESAIKGENKYSDEGGIKAKRNVFKTKAGNWMANANNNAMEFEDAIFSKSAFRSALSEYLTANGIKTEADIKNNPALVEKAKDYALEEAHRATFRQDSWVANKISEIERKNLLTSVAVGSIMPFKKTPINIAKTGLAYSPLGLARSFYDAVQVGRGKMDASEAVDHLAQGMTGSVLAIIGFALADAGILNGAGDDDKEGEYDYQLGEQSYSFNFGGDSYSLSWLSPVSMPLFIGANAYEQLVENKEWDADVVMETLAQTLDPMSEMSFLSSLDNVLSSYDSGVEKFAGIAESMGQSYVSQFIPTLSSQIAQTFDDTKRSTKVSADSGYKFGEETLNKIKYKIPGLRNTLEPATDIWGNEIKQSDNVLERGFEAFLSPASRKEYITTAVDEEIKDLYGQTGDAGVMPSIPDNYINYDGNKYEMSAKDYTEYKELYGQTAFELMEKLFDTETYKNADSETRADMVNRVYDYARDNAKLKYFTKFGVDYTNAQEEGEEVYKENPIKGAIEADLPIDEYVFSQDYPKKYSFFKDNGISYQTFASASEEDKRAYNWAYDNPGKYTASKAVTDDLLGFYEHKRKIAEIADNNDSSKGTKDKDLIHKYIFSLDLDYGQKAIFYALTRGSNISKADKEEYKDDIVNYLNGRDDISYEEEVAILEGLGMTVDKDGYVDW